MPYWDAFATLSSSRPLSIGMGGGVYGSIPYGSKSQYARDHDLIDDPAEFELFLILVGALDAVYVEHCNKKK